MNIKWFIGIGILVGIACAGYGVYNMKMNMTILSILGVFTMTNLMRSQAFKDQGFAKEARLMNIIAASFSVLFVVVLVVTVIL